MKIILAALATLSFMSYAHAGMTRYVPDPPRVQHEFATVGDGSAESNLSEGRSVHEDSDRDQAHAESAGD